jgi:hypothetical protein
MITSIVLSSADSDMDDVELKVKSASSTDKYILKGVDGLGPPDINARTGSQYYDGVIYKGRRSELRNVVIRIGLKPNYALGESVSQLRDDLYAQILEGENGEITDNFDNEGLFTITVNDSIKGARILRGAVEKFEVALFSNEPEVQLSILCPYPYLIAPNLVTVTVNGLSSNINYLGTKRVGFLTEILVTGTTPNITLQEDPSFSITDDVEPFLAGDKVYIKSSLPTIFENVNFDIVNRPGPFAMKLPAGSPTFIDLMDAVDLGSIWPKFNRGMNTVEIPTPSPSYQISKIYYYVTDWGV